MAEKVTIEAGQAPTLQQQLDTMWARVRENGKVIAALERDQANEIAGYCVARMAEKERERTATAQPESPPPAPLTLAERADLDAYGCQHRAERLREIADARGLRLSIPSHRTQAEAALFAETGAGVMQARTLVEGVHALAREKGLSFVEMRDGTYAKLCESVVTLRPELRPDYRGGRPTAFPGRPTRHAQPGLSPLSSM